MEFSIKSFVSTEQQIELVGQTIEESYVDGIYNPMLLSVLFKVNVLLTYTDMPIDKSDKLAAYDLVVREFGGWDDFMAETTCDEEINLLWKYLETWVVQLQAYKGSVLGALDGLRQSLDEIVLQTRNAMEDLKDIDTNSLTQIVALAEEYGAPTSK